MESVLGTRVDLKNIELSKLIFDLRQDLDLHCLLCANWDKIERCFGIAGLFPQIHRRALGESFWVFARFTRLKEKCTR